MRVTLLLSLAFVAVVTGQIVQNAVWDTSATPTAMGSGFDLVSGPNVYLATRSDYSIVAYNKTNGAIVWSRGRMTVAAGTVASTARAIAGSLFVFVHPEGDHVVAIDTNTGLNAWVFEGRDVAHIVVDGPRILINSRNSVVALNAFGNVLWTFVGLPSSPMPFGAPVPTATNILLKTKYHVFAVDRNGDGAWTVAMGTNNGAVTYMHDMVASTTRGFALYGLSRNNVSGTGIFAFDLASGLGLWHQWTTSSMPMIAASEQWLAVTIPEAALTSVYNPTTGMMLWQYQAPTTQGNPSRVPPMILPNGDIIIASTRVARVRRLTTSTSSYEVWGSVPSNTQVDAVVSKMVMQGDDRVILFFAGHTIVHCVSTRYGLPLWTYNTTFAFTNVVAWPGVVFASTTYSVVALPDGLQINRTDGSENLPPTVAVSATQVLMASTLYIPGAAFAAILQDPAMTASLRTALRHDVGLLVGVPWYNVLITAMRPGLDMDFTVLGTGTGHTSTVEAAILHVAARNNTWLAETSKLYRSVSSETLTASHRATDKRDVGKECGNGCAAAIVVAVVGGSVALLGTALYFKRNSQSVEKERKQEEAMKETEPDQEVSRVEV